MYEEFYGLKADPFRLSADHRFRFEHRSYARAKAYVQYALHRAEGFVMVTGRPGTGKTTLIHDLLASLPDKEFVAGTLVSTQLGAEDLLLMTGYAFGLDFPTSQKAGVLQRLMQFLQQQHRQGLRTLLIIDEAQDLAPSALEELRLLTNLQHNGVPLLQIALLGQEALRTLVRSRAMEQVHQRLIAAWQLDPLGPEETIGYVRHRLERAGWQGNPTFEPGVLRIVHGFSEGVPRRINLFCSRLMLHGFIGECHTLTVADAVTVSKDLHREELARWDYEPDEALAHTLAPGEHDAGQPAAAGGDSRDNVWAGIDHGLFWSADPRNPEPAAPPVPERPQAGEASGASRVFERPEAETAPGEARVPERTEADAAPGEARVPERPGADTAPDEVRVAKRPEPDTALGEARMPARPAVAKGPAETSMTAPEPASLLKAHAAASSAPPPEHPGGASVRADAQAADAADAMPSIVPARSEHWESTAAAAGSGQRPSRVWLRFLLVGLVTVAVVAVLFLVRPASVQESSVADGVSGSVASLEQWWGESSAAARAAWQSLRAQIAGNGDTATHDGETAGAADGAGEARSLRAPGAGAEPDALRDELRVDAPDPAVVERAPGNGVERTQGNGNGMTAGATPAPETGLESGAALASSAAPDERFAVPLEGVAGEASTATPVTGTTVDAAATAADSSVSPEPEPARPAGLSVSQPSEASIESPVAPALADATSDTVASVRAGEPAPARPLPAPVDPLMGSAAPAERPEAAVIRETAPGAVRGEPAALETLAPATPSLSGRVFFRVDSVTMDPRFEPLMSEIAEALVQSGGSYAEIVGYTDTTGPVEYNRYLSNRRAEAVAEQLKERGIPAARLRIEGQGPREAESGEQGFRAADRVVEITIRPIPGNPL